MKKIKVIILLIGIIILSGCSKKLTCTYQSETDNNKIVINFKEDKVISVKEENKKTFDSLDAHIDLYNEEQIETYKVLDNINGVTYDVKEKKNDVITTVNVDYEIYNSNNNLIKINKDMTYDNIINLYQSNGYSCK